MDCYACESKLIWGGDHTYEDYGIDGDGMVTNLSCSNEDCDVESVLVYTNNETVKKDTAKDASISLEAEIREAYVFLREKNTDIPSGVLQFMLDASLEKLKSL
jgi:hypothetical protein